MIIQCIYASGNILYNLFEYMKLSDTIHVNVLNNVQARIGYKLSTICHKYFSDSSPAYFPDVLTVCIPSRQLRSFIDTRTLCPHVRTKQNKQLWPTLFLLPCLQNCVKNSPLQAIRHQVINLVPIWRTVIHDLCVMMDLPTVTLMFFFLFFFGVLSLMTFVSQRTAVDDVCVSRADGLR